MPWQHAVSLPFSRIGIAAQVPATSGLYGIFRGDRCVLVGNTWNLKAHLLELITRLPSTEDLNLKFELHTEKEAAELSAALTGELARARSAPASAAEAPHPPGITFWEAHSFSEPNSPDA